MTSVRNSVTCHLCTINELGFPYQHLILRDIRTSTEARLVGRRESLKFRVAENSLRSLGGIKDQKGHTVPSRLWDSNCILCIGSCGGVVVVLAIVLALSSLAGRK